MAFSWYITELAPQNEWDLQMNIYIYIDIHHYLPPRGFVRLHYWNGFPLTQGFFRGSSIIFLPLFITNHQDRDTFRNRSSIHETDLRTLKFYKTVKVSFHMVYLKHAKNRMELHRQALRSLLSKYGAGAVLFRPASSANQKRANEEASCSLELQPVFF